MGRERDQVYGGGRVVWVVGKSVVAIVPSREIGGLDYAVDLNDSSVLIACELSPRDQAETLQWLSRRLLRLSVKCLERAEAAGAQRAS